MTSLMIDCRNHIGGNCYDYIDEHGKRPPRSPAPARRPARRLPRAHHAQRAAQRTAYSVQHA